jgi:hypothetical protein
MKRNLIKTDNYLLVVDESVKEINNGEYFLLGGKHVNMWAGSGTRIMTDVTGKIISHAPLNGAPYLDGVDVLPPTWRDSGEEESKTNFAEVFYRLLKNTYPTFEEWIEAIEYRKQSREKYKFTEEHVFGFLTYYNSINFNKSEYRYKHPTMDGSEREYNRSIDRKILAEYIQSLQQPKLPIAFECITDFDCCRRYVNCWGCDAPPDIINLRPKTITNAEGRTEWVGKYIYE